jgi:Fe-S oxidoreductase
VPERPDFWGIPPTWHPALLVYGIMILAALILLYRTFREASVWWRVGRPEVRWTRLDVRLGRLITYAIVQIRVLGQRYPGIMHIALAWAFFVFFAGTTLAAIDGHIFKFLRGDVYLFYKLILDSFTVLFLFGAALAAYRRFVQKPPRLTLRAGFTWSLLLIIVIVLSGLIVESLRLAVEQPDWGYWSPAGWLLAQAWIATGASAGVLTSWHLALWSFHLSLIVVLFVTLTSSTLLHIVTGPLNVFFSKLDRPMGQLAPVGLTPAGEPVYVHTLRDLTWKQLLDSDACTECGRCQDACPAFAAGMPLSPKQLMVNLREALRRDGPAIASAARADGAGRASGGTSQKEASHGAASAAGNGGNKVSAGGEPPLPSQKDVPLVDAAVPEAMLWSCTTCGACVRECPILIEHVDTIVDMRRYLVYEGRMDARLQEALANLGRYGNSFGQSERARAKWTRAAQVKIKDARKEAVEYLWFVGDYASYSAGLTDITAMTAAVFDRAGLDFGILYEGERNAGNDVRRIGEEGLFEMLVEKNLDAIGKARLKAIVTTDPHSYNVLKNEYPFTNPTPKGTGSSTDTVRRNGDGRYPVLHYAELLDQLIADGRLKFSRKLNRRVTYHDPCYLGRYNGVYDAPRRVISATGCELVEMPRHGDRTFCCGAGGGRIWMEEGEMTERPSEARIREAAALAGVTEFVVACPKDITMFRDAVKTTGHEDRLVVKDLIQLVHEAL